LRPRASKNALEHGIDGTRQGVGRVIGKEDLNESTVKGNITLDSGLKTFVSEPWTCDININYTRVRIIVN
jgi:hypothetical protein